MKVNSGSEKPGATQSKDTWRNRTLFNPNRLPAPNTKSTAGISITTNAIPKTLPLLSIFLLFPLLN